MTDSQKQSSRGRRETVLKVRLSEGEKALLDRKAQDAGMTKAEFVRLHIGKAQVVNRSDWRRLVYQVGHVANVMEQIVQWAQNSPGNDSVQVVATLLSIERILFKAVFKSGPQEEGEGRRSINDGDVVNS